MTQLCTTRFAYDCACGQNAPWRVPPPSSAASAHEPCCQAGVVLRSRLNVPEAEMAAELGMAYCVSVTL